MGKMDFYESELARLKEDGLHVKVKFYGDKGNDTKYMNLNDQSIEAITNYLTELKQTFNL